MKRLAEVALIILFCTGFFSLAVKASQIPTAIPAPKRALEKQDTTVYPEAGKDGYTVPQCSYCPNPQYTDKAFRERINGALELSIVVFPDGRAHQVRVTKSLDKGLDQASMDIILKKWRFKPAFGPNGKPAAVHMPIELTFHLH
jgi:TonB family protein